MFGHVDGSMATAARSRLTGGRAVLAREGMPAMLATRRRRKQPKRSGGNTGNTGNPLPQSGAPDSSTILGASVYPPAAGLRRMGWRKWAETGGNSLQKICSRSCPYFYCLAFGVHSKSLIGVSLAEIAEIPPFGRRAIAYRNFRRLDRGPPRLCSGRVPSRVRDLTLNDKPLIVEKGSVHGRAARSSGSDIYPTWRSIRRVRLLRLLGDGA